MVPASSLTERTGRNAALVPDTAAISGTVTTDDVSAVPISET